MINYAPVRIDLMDSSRYNRAMVIVCGESRGTAMLPSEVLNRRRPEILAIMRRYEAQGIVNLRVFGSVARNADSSQSDIDFLVDAGKVSLLTLGGLQSELEDLLGVPVDVVPSDAIKGDARGEILAEAVTV